MMSVDFCMFFGRWPVGKFCILWWFPDYVEMILGDCCAIMPWDGDPGRSVRVKVRFFCLFWIFLYKSKNFIPDGLCPKDFITTPSSEKERTPSSSWNDIFVDFRKKWPLWVRFVENVSNILKICCKSLWEIEAAENVTLFFGVLLSQCLEFASLVEYCKYAGIILLNNGQYAQECFRWTDFGHLVNKHWKILTFCSISKHFVHLVKKHEDLFVFSNLFRVQLVGGLRDFFVAWEIFCVLSFFVAWRFLVAGRWIEW